MVDETSSEHLLIPGTRCWLKQQPKNAPAPVYLPARVKVAHGDGTLTICVLEGSQHSSGALGGKEITARAELLLLANDCDSCVEVRGPDLGSASHICYSTPDRVQHPLLPHTFAAIPRMLLIVCIHMLCVASGALSDVPLRHCPSGHNMLLTSPFDWLHRT